MDRFFLKTFSMVIVVVLLSRCGQSASDRLDTSNAASGIGSDKESLYVASGSCYGGGVTTSVGSATIAAFDPSNGSLRRLVMDYGTSSPGDMPVAVSDYDPTRIMVTIENASGRRIDLVNKDGSGYATYVSNSSALNSVLRSSKLLADGSLLVSKSTAIEKFAPSKARILQSGLPYVSAPGSVCGPTTSLITGVDALANGKIIYVHSGATPNNKINLISATGYASAADCLATASAPTALAMPTAILSHSSGQIITAWGSTTTASNFVYTYPLDPLTNIFGTPVASLTDTSIVNGPSALAEDVATTDVFVANALSTMNTIERFSYDSSSGLMTRLPVSRVGPNIYTRCVAAMKVIKE